MRITASQREYLFGDVFCQTIRKLCGVGHQYLGDAGGFRCSFCSSAAVVTGDEDVDFTTALRGSGNGI